MSKRTLARRFAEATGVTPIDWVIGLRIARAKDLLESKPLSVEELASQCGFTSAPPPTGPVSPASARHLA